MSPASTRRRPTKEEIDEDILDITAGLIACRGIKDTAPQAVADEAGYSKAAQVTGAFGALVVLSLT